MGPFSGPNAFEKGFLFSIIYSSNDFKIFLICISCNIAMFGCLEIGIESSRKHSVLIFVHDLAPFKLNHDV